MHPRQLFTWDRLWRGRYQILGVVLLVLGLGVTVSLASAASSAKPPDVAQSAIFVLVSGALNLGGVWLFSRNPGGANLTASRIALRHLGTVARATIEVRERTEAAFEMRDGKAVRMAVGHLSVQLSAIEQQLGSNLEDWVQAYPDLSPISGPQTAAEFGETKAIDD